MSAENFEKLMQVDNTDLIFEVRSFFKWNFETKNKLNFYILYYF
mgnify:CR=1 FL=1